MLSPETNADKLEASLRLLIAKVGDREAFRHWVDEHPQRRWLKARVADIQASHVKEIVVADQENIYKRFRDSHPRLAPRHQRDLPRIIGLVKAHALLNWRHRERPREQTIIANQEDVDAGFWLYNQISEANELGLPPQLYEIHKSVITPLLETDSDGNGIDRKMILAEYYARYERPLSEDRLRRETLPKNVHLAMVRVTPQLSQLGRDLYERLRRTENMTLRDGKATYKLWLTRDGVEFLQKWCGGREETGQWNMLKNSLRRNSTSVRPYRKLKLAIANCITKYGIGRTTTKNSWIFFAVVWRMYSQ
jgi:hypothetical protein